MKKTLFICCMTLLISSSSSFNYLNAQDNSTEKTQPEKIKKSKFGSFIRKVGETTTGINMTNEPFIINPLLTAFDVEFVSATGDASTGRVSLIFKVKVKINNESGTARFGGSLDKTAAYDKSGKIYKQYESIGGMFEVPKGIWREIELTGNNAAFRDVPETLEAFELINIYCIMDANNRGLIEFHNIPIIWNTQKDN